MIEGQKSASWWHTLPGVLTATAAIITALSGLVVALFQAGVFSWGTSKADAETPSASVPAPDSSLQTPPAQTASTSLTPDAANSSQTQRSSPSGLTRTASRTNLLAQENGGHVIVASGDDWLWTIDGKTAFNQISYGLASQSEAVYAFKDEKPATVEMFTMYIDGTGDANVKEFELFVASDSPIGPFDSIGKFQTQNVKLYRTPFQEFPLQPVKAKYVKIKLHSSYGFTHPQVMEVQLFGRLESN